MAEAIKSYKDGWSSTEPGALMRGKRGLIMGVANHNSIGWGIARALSQHGALLAFTCQSEALERRVRPLAAQVGSDIVERCEVEDTVALSELFDNYKSGKTLKQEINQKIINLDKQNAYLKHQHYIKPKVKDQQKEKNG